MSADGAGQAHPRTACPGRSPLTGSEIAPPRRRARPGSGGRSWGAAHQGRRWRSRRRRPCSTRVRRTAQAPVACAGLGPQAAQRASQAWTGGGLSPPALAMPAWRPCQRLPCPPRSAPRATPVLPHHPPRRDGLVLCRVMAAGRTPRARPRRAAGQWPPGAMDPGRRRVVSSGAASLAPGEQAPGMVRAAPAVAMTRAGAALLRRGRSRRCTAGSTPARGARHTTGAAARVSGASYGGQAGVQGIHERRPGFWQPRFRP